MITVKVDAKRVIDHLGTIAGKIPAAIDKGLGEWARKANKAAVANLSGSAGEAGAYPVPVRTGFLRRNQSAVLPNQSKNGVTATTGQAFLINPSIYAKDIHDGQGVKHSKFGPRPFAWDAVESTRKDGMAAITKHLHHLLAA